MAKKPATDIESEVDITSDVIVITENTETSDDPVVVVSEFDIPASPASTPKPRRSLLTTSNSGRLFF